MLAYKGFNKDLTCTMGNGVFQYVPGVRYTEENAHCGRDGFHATDNPLGVLSYYDKSDDRYFEVELEGNIDEDGVNSRISAPVITLKKELTKHEMYVKGLFWMAEHPKAEVAAVVERDIGDARGKGHVLVRGRKPKAQGKLNDILYFAVENKKGEIRECGAYRIDGKQYKEDTYYNVKGEAVNG